MAAPGDKVTFVAAAGGAPEPTVRWQVSPDGGRTWSAVEGATQNAYSFTAQVAQDGYGYRAEFTNPGGTTRTSPITLTVTDPDAGGNGGNGGGEGGAANSGPSGTSTVTGPNGQKLTVTPVDNLATENQTLKVTGSGYDPGKGIYVALCVDNGDGEPPTPCIGGVDMGRRLAILRVDLLRPAGLRRGPGDPVRPGRHVRGRADRRRQGRVHRLHQGRLRPGHPQRPHPLGRPHPGRQGPGQLRRAGPGGHRRRHRRHGRERWLRREHDGREHRRHGDDVHHGRLRR
ncbi:immunoglobulin domain-containing protein [Streptomyces sp. NPDC008343]|uniref:immunoglobulin domain-containing protein n=1 Tax=Streptomyces sp. NPDC008343 TaxID=3364828 RepID=UPI0036EFE991